jgi:excisionase family DNA binding protein
MRSEPGLVEGDRQSDRHSRTLIDRSVNYHRRMLTDTQQREWLAPKEVAAELRVHVSAVYRAVERGELPAVRLSETGAIRIPRSALDHTQK